jgi:alpha/beta superfamily hydrolase
MKLTLQSQALGGTPLDAEFEQAENSQGLMILSRNASGDMDNKIIVALSQACLKNHISSLRFNFHYVGGIGSEKAEIKIFT